MRRNLVAISVILLGMLSCVTGRTADKDAPLTIQARKRLEQFQQGRAKLKTGIASVEQVVKTDRQGKEVSAKTKYFLAFDYASGRQRFDCDVEDQPGFGYRQIRKEDKVFRSGTQGKAVTIHRADFKSASFYQSFDVRNAGLADYHNFANDVPFERMFDIFFKAATIRTVTFGRVLLDEQELDKLTFFADPDSKVEYSIWFDPNLDSVPVRWEHSSLDRTRQERLRVDWQKRNGAIVPQTMLFEEFDGTSIELNFTWELVNQPPGDQLFDLTAIANEGAFIFDRTEGESNQPIGVVKARPAIMPQE